VGISLKPAQLKRYRDIARLVLKYGGGDAVRQAGLEAALEGAQDNGSISANAEALADDLEGLGPTFIKLGQVLSTRQDLLPRQYSEALARLQDRVARSPTSWSSRPSRTSWASAYQRSSPSSIPAHSRRHRSARCTAQ